MFRTWQNNVAPLSTPLMNDPLRANWRRICQYWHSSSLVSVNTGLTWSVRILNFRYCLFRFHELRTLSRWLCGSSRFYCHVLQRCWDTDHYVDSAIDCLLQLRVQLLYHICHVLSQLWLESDHVCSRYVADTATTEGLVSDINSQDFIVLTSISLTLWYACTCIQIQRESSRKAMTILMSEIILEYQFHRDPI